MIKKGILDIIFPRHCLGCDILLGNETDSYLCHACLKTVPFTKGFACAFCKSPVKAGKTCVYCIKNHHLDRLLVAASYENRLVEKILKTVKYRFVKSLAADMADFMIKYLTKKTGWLVAMEAITIVPIPLHRRRFNWRGFNQAQIVAEKIRESFGWPVITNAIERTRNSKPQAYMPDKQSRIENMHNIFNFQGSTLENHIRPFTGKTILLIDDISTTGSTLDDGARALKGAGAKEVIGFVFAKGKLDKN